MSRNSRHNRTARKRRQEQHYRAGSHRPEPDRADSVFDEHELIRAGLHFAYGPSANATSLQHVITVLVRLESAAPTADAIDLCERILDLFLGYGFDAGWQPAELVHAARRVCGARSGRLAVAAIAAHAARTSAYRKAPPQWRSQLAELRIQPSRQQGYVALWRRKEALDSADGWQAILTLLGFLHYLPRLQELIPPPSKWGDEPGPARTTETSRDARVLAKIRALLVKAESTTFAAEAEALSAKAQDMMTRYAIDQAVLDAKAQTSPSALVQTRRLLLDSPYTDAKATLLHHVAEANGARMLLIADIGIASIVGMPVDLDLCELLFTSLLVQSAHALAEAGDKQRTNRAPSFRRSFLAGFGQRIGERLTLARDDAGRAAARQYGKELVPIMAERTEAVDSVFAEQFPKTVSKAQSVSNASGYHAGRVAGELADLTGGRERLTG